MNQEVQTTKDTKVGTLANSETVKRKAGRPPKSEGEQSNIPDGVIADTSELNLAVAKARRSGESVLVTKEVLEDLLLSNYKNDKMLIYHNVALVDWTRVKEVEKETTRTVNDVIFGGSKITIKDR